MRHAEMVSKKTKGHEFTHQVLAYMIEQLQLQMCTFLDLLKNVYNLTLQFINSTSLNQTQSNILKLILLFKFQITNERLLCLPLCL